MAENYQAKQGDSIFSIAFEHGFFADTIWDHPNNKELKEKRKDPNVLLPGDLVYIPDKRLREYSEATNQVYKYKCKNTPKILSIQIMRSEKPVAEMNFTLDIDGLRSEGKTDSSGWIKKAVAPHAKKAVITLEEGQEFELRLGFLDPIDEISGLQGRLKTLGYYEGAVDGKMSEATTDALKVFQNSNEIDVTGVADDSTKGKLKDLIGS